MCTKIFKNIYKAIHDKKDKNKKPTRINPNVYEHRMVVQGTVKQQWKQTIPRKYAKAHSTEGKVKSLRSPTLHPFL